MNGKPKEEDVGRYTEQRVKSLPTIAVPALSRLDSINMSDNH